jgi:hypothetical protein
MSINQSIEEAINQLNTFQGKGYLWPSNIDGSVGDVLYENKIVLKGNPDNYTYCCGLTLQVYLMACNKLGKHLGSLSDVYAIKRKWFIADPVQPLSANKGQVDALVPRQLGVEVFENNVQKFDFAQLWRKTGSGHSVVFITFVEERGRKAIKYWSTQRSTNGIGYKTEWLDNMEKVYYCHPI